MHNLPILYSFRRCPYAIRARMAVHASGLQVELREVSLKEKPQAMLHLSEKATVPVLQAKNGEVIDESIDILFWALKQNDPLELLSRAAEHKMALRLLLQNDTEFKQALDRYKYSDRFPECTIDEHWQCCLGFLNKLNQMLMYHPYLLSERCSWIDLAVFPFIRQLAAVDQKRFEATGFSALQEWLQAFLQMPLFTEVMQKYPPWRPGDKPLLILCHE